MPKKVIKQGKEDGEGKRAPKGHFVVYVGEEQRRFVVPLDYLKHREFKRLMEDAADEFGYNCSKRIVLPCDESTFCMVTQSLASLTSPPPYS